MPNRETKAILVAIVPWLAALAISGTAFGIVLASMSLAEHEQPEHQPSHHRPTEAEEIRRLAPAYKAIAIDGDPGARAWDGSRADIVAPGRVYEVEFADKYKESVFQALYYSEAFRKPPGIILVLRGKSPTEAEARAIYKLKIVCSRLDVPIFVEPGGASQQPATQPSK